MTLFSCVACGYRQEHVNHELNNRLNRIERLLVRVLQEQGIIVTDQEHLDADVAQLATAVGVIAQEISDLKNQPGAGALDFTGLDAAVASVAGLEPAPAEPPADGGDQPAA